MSTKSQVFRHCATCASHHVSLAKLHRTAAAAADCDGAHAQFHKSAAEVHTSQAEHYLAMCKSLDGEIDTHDDSRGTDSIKIGRSEVLTKFGMLAAKDADKLVPTRVHLALPDMPPNVRLVGRPGGPPVNVEPDATDAIDSLSRSPGEIAKAILG